jgi:hypothetical protein
VGEAHPLAVGEFLDEVHEAAHVALVGGDPDRDPDGAERLPWQESFRVMLYFIVPSDAMTGIDGTTVLDAAAWDEWVRRWGAMFDPQLNLKQCIALPITYGELDALSYRSSEPLDIEYTSLA